MATPIGKWFEIFRAGTHTDSAGEEATWTEADLDAIVSNFKDNAPITIKHPEADPVTEELCWGKLDGVKRDGKSLFARIGSMVEGLGEILSNGMLPQRSVGLSGNGDSLRLNHLALLGVTPPAVKGMPALAFNAGETVRNFSMEGLSNDPMAQIGVIKGMLTAIMGMLGKGEAAEAKEEADFAASDKDGKPETSKKEDDMTPEQIKEMEDLKAANAELGKKYSEAEATIKTFEAEKSAAIAAAKIAEFSAWADAQITAGKVLPAEKIGIMAVLESIDAGKKCEFSAADGSKVEKTAAQIYRESIEARPENKLTTEFAVNGKPRTLPGGSEIEQAIAKKMEEKKCDYSSAMRMVLIEQPELNK